MQNRLPKYVCPRTVGTDAPNNIAVARAVDREFNYNFGSNFALLGSGRGLNRRGAPVGSIWTEFQLKQSHSDPFNDPNHVLVRPILPWY